MSVPAAYLAVVLIWSTTPLAVKWSGEGPGFLFGALGRMALAVLLCLTLVKVLRLGLPLHRHARRTYGSGALGLYGAMLCIYWAAQYVPSGLIAVLFGLSPLVTALLARPLLGEHGLSAPFLLGMLLALLGLVIIFGASIALGPQTTEGLIGLLAGVFLQSLSMVLVKRFGEALPSLTVSAGSLLIAAPLFLVTWLVFDHHIPQLPTRALASMLYLGVVGSVIGFTLFFYLLKHVTANTTALITLITPVLALLLGAAINHEPVSLRIWTGTALVLSGLALHQWGGLIIRVIRLRSGDR